MIAVLKQIASVSDTAGTQIDCHHNLRINCLRPLCKLIDTDLIRLKAAPCQLQTSRALVYRPYAVLPYKAGYKVSTWITYDRYIQLLYQLHDITAETVLIS